MGKKFKTGQSETLAVTISVCVQVRAVLPWLHQSQQWREQLKHKDLTLGEVKVCEPQEHQETTSGITTAQQVRDEAQETTPGGRVDELRSQGLPGMTVSQPDWLASPI